MQAHETTHAGQPEKDKKHQAGKAGRPRHCFLSGEVEAGRKRNMQAILN
jgi:hypothetical protein